MESKSKNKKTSQITQINIYTDGASRGNPGPAGIGILAVKNNKILYEDKEQIGKHTNNEAEYKAIKKGLQLAKRYKAQKITVTSDSELVTKQLKGEYQVKAPNLQPLHQEVKKKEKQFKEVKYQHRKRNNKYIQRADELANKALDQRKTNKNTR